MRSPGMGGTCLATIREEITSLHYFLSCDKMVSGEDTSTNKNFSCVLSIIYTIIVLIVLKAAKS
jgi:hypothetical protein